ncbi:MAG: hypothetical protein AAF766_00250 [Cyanobacteria bacterium P01_D01_bin.14]
MTPHHILHIGTHKTGTTYLQRLLADNRAKLLENAIDYPEIGRVLDLSSAQAHRYISAYFRHKTEEYPDSFPTHLQTPMTAADRCLLSSEDFYFCSRRLDLIDGIRQHFGKRTTIMCFLREPKAHLLSMYKMFIKSGICLSLDAFLDKYTRGLTNRTLGSKPGKFTYYQYDFNLSLWQSCFQDVRVARYRKHDNPSQLLSDFLDLAELDIHMTDLAVLSANDTKTLSKNPSLSGISSFALYRINQMVRDGILDLHSRKCLKKMIIKNDLKLRQLIEPNVVWGEVPFTRFIEHFLQVNPIYSALFLNELDPSAVVFPTAILLSDDDLLAAVKSCQESSDPSSQLEGMRKQVFQNSWFKKQTYRYGQFKRQLGDKLLRR